MLHPTSTRRRARSPWTRRRAAPPVIHRLSRVPVAIRARPIGACELQVSIGPLPPRPLRKKHAMHLRAAPARTAESYTSMSRLPATAHVHRLATLRSPGRPGRHDPRDARPHDRARRRRQGRTSGRTVMGGLEVTVARGPPSPPSLERRRFVHGAARPVVGEALLLKGAPDDNAPVPDG